jgi:hypothetical protein
MEAMFCEEHVDATAESIKGDETWAPLAGELTVTPARAGTAGRASNNVADMRAERRFMTFLLKLVESITG